MSDKPTFRITGMDAGRHRVRFEPSGEERLLTDAELEEIQGGKTVKKLDDDKEIVRLKAENEAIGREKVRLDTELALAQEQAATLKKASEEWQVRAQQAEAQVDSLTSRANAAEATVAELQAENAQLKKAPEAVKDIPVAKIADNVAPVIEEPKPEKPAKLNDPKGAKKGK